jgi:hypothetical protein
MQHRRGPCHEAALNPFSITRISVAFLDLDKAGNESLTHHFMNFIDRYQVGDLPSKDVPVRVGVAGTPLVVQKERVLTKGLRGKMWRTGIEYGELPVGVPLEKTFYVFNTGGLGERLHWWKACVHGI